VHDEKDSEDGKEQGIAGEQGIVVDCCGRERAGCESAADVIIDLRHLEKVFRALFEVEKLMLDEFIYD